MSDKRRRVYLDELIDAHGVAAILGLRNSRIVSEYQQSYLDMPRPVIELPNAKIWLKPEIEKWQDTSKRKARKRS